MDVEGMGVPCIRELNDIAPDVTRFIA